MPVTTRRSRAVTVATSLLLAGTGLALMAGTPAASGADRDQGPLFEPLPGFELPGGDRARVRPQEYEAFDVRVEAVAARLTDAPGPRRAARGAARSVVTLPDPQGRPVRFEVQRSRVAEAGFASAHPELQTWQGRAAGDPTTRLALDVTPMGLHAFVRRQGAGRSWYIDPAMNRRGTTAHLSYFGGDLRAAPFDFRPPVDGPRTGRRARRAASAQARTAPGTAVVLRTFRLALVNDPTYADYFGAGNVAAEKVTLINRVNQIYRDDFAIRLLLVDGTDRLNLDTDAEASGAGGPCGAHGCYEPDDLAYCSPDLIERNAFAIGQLVGAENYDIGHIGLGVNGGGIAGLAVVGDAWKAAGCTGLPVPYGDFYAVDYVAHEMGHQFAANHTFNGNQGSCSLTNRNPGTSVEPGSGSSVMAYAGICGRDDLQPHTDPYFSQRSQDEVDGLVTDEILVWDEVQTISLTDWDASVDAFQLTVPGQTPVQIDFGTADYSADGLRDRVEELTGYRPRVFGYDGAAQPDQDGFELVFDRTGEGAGIDVPRIGVENAGGDVTGSTGVQVDGGGSTNQGFAVTMSNHAPSVVAPPDRTLPVRTPFTLTGAGTDVDGDDLVYLWEQDDEGLDPTEGSFLLDNTKTAGPLFRIFSTAALVSFEDSLEYYAEGQNAAGTSPTRTFPDLTQVLAGDTNAETGGCPEPPADPSKPVPAEVLACFSEFLPTQDYVGDPAGEGAVLNFRLTARDQAPTAAGTGFDDVTLTLDPTAGPLLIDSQAGTGAVRDAGSTETVTWAVNGTDDEGLAPQVRIALSADGGASFPYVLARSTPNDGSQEITWPAIFSDRVRLRVQAVGNYFFDVNDADLTVISSLQVTSDAGTASAAFSDDLDTPLAITARSGEVDADELTIDVDGVTGLQPVESTATEDGVRPAVATWLLDGPIAAEPGDRIAEVTVTDPAYPDDEGGAAIVVTVRPETAIVRWTGPDEALVDEPVTLSADVSDAEDGSPGDVTTSRLRFVDRGDGSTICAADVTGTSAEGSASCEATFGSPGDRTVGLVLSGPHASDSADDDQTLSVGEPDETPPETRITAGPPKLVPRSVVTVRYAADEEATFECQLDDATVVCDGDRVRLGGLSAGMHRFRVWAVDTAGNRDESPGVRRFAVAYDDRQLHRSRGWRNRFSGRAFRGTYRQTFGSGPRLWRDVRGGRRIGVVVGTGPRHGRIDVLVRGQRVHTVDLSGPWRMGRVVAVQLPQQRTGRFAIRSRGGGRVRIDGLAVFQP